MQLLFKIQMEFFIEIVQKVLNLYGTTKDPKLPKQSWEKRTKLEVSPSQTSDYMKKSWNQNAGIVTKTDT